MRSFVITLFLSAVLSSAPGVVWAEEFDYSKDKVLHVVGTAHLDTQWRWTIQQTINEYIPNTLQRNFELFEKYPDYVFSFEGAFRYMLAKEYYPDDFARMKNYIDQGRWAVCGSSVDAGDMNVPSPESIMRHILYGNGYFRKEFGKTSRDIFLPDCFGFGYTLPSIAAHCGLKGFSSQKLTWGSAIGIPFDVGVWEGVDGSKIVAQLNPDEYVARVRDDLSSNKRWVDTVEKQGKESGLYVGYKYFGTGDIGGAPDDESVSWVMKSLRGSGPLKVISVPADRLACELTPAQMERLPHYKGELLMTTHGTGCYTSQAAMKRWNRQNELLADSAERASVTADWLGGAPYPTDTLREAWIRFLWHQFHDDLTGTSIPEAYPFSWNDEIIALNRFSSVLENAAGAVSRGLDTRTQGQPVMVYNPLAVEREDVVEAEIPFPDVAPKCVRVYGPSGIEVPSQVSGVTGNTVTVLFLARMSSVGFAVYDVRPSDAPCALETGLTANQSTLENGRYIVRIDRDGNVSGITDKQENRELLTAPIRLDLFRNESRVWPAWEVTYEAVSTPPVDYVKDPVSVRLVESGPVRATLEVVRMAGDSKFVQHIRLAAGEAGNRVEFENDVDWRTKERLLKASFPLAVANEKATYDLGLGVIQRGNNTKQLYEVPGQQWADLTTPDFKYGVSILNDSRYGWDKPDDSTLRLTLLHTPKPGSYQDQAMLDIGRHRFTYAVAGHKACWRAGRTFWEAARLNQPLMAFLPPKHDGTLARSFSMLQVNKPQVMVRAFKKAEESDEYIVRLEDMFGRECPGVEVSFPVPVLSAREVNGAEEPMDGDVEVRDGKLVIDLAAYKPRAFAVKLAYPGIAYVAPRSLPIELPFNIDVVTLDSDRADGCFDGKGHTYSGELLPSALDCEGIAFRLGSGQPGMKNAVACQGQTIQLPRGDFNRLYILASALGDTKGTFAVNGRQVELKVQDYTAYIGQWDSRIVNGEVVNNVFQVAPAFIKRDPVAWVGTHRHSAGEGNEAYVFTYLFRYELELPPNARTLTLPDNANIRVFAVSAAKNFNAEVRPAQLLYDAAQSTSVAVSTVNGGYFLDEVTVTLTPSPEGAEIRYTLDGSDPDASSPVYRGPFTVRENLTLKARAFSPDIEESHLLVYPFVKVVPVAAVANPGALKPGLRCELYTGTWDVLPDFDQLRPVKRSIETRFVFPDGTPGDHFGIRYTGYFEAKEGGVYTFATASDDGSRLYIGDKMVVDSDGLHGPDEITGTIALAPGMHPITVTFFEKEGGEQLKVYCSGPGMAKGEIGPNMLFCK